jgi:hypothetical protein
VSDTSGVVSRQDGVVVGAGLVSGERHSSLAGRQWRGGASELHGTTCVCL